MPDESSIAVTRLKKDYIKFKKDPLPFISAEPLHSNILEWHYVIQGPPDSPYCGGVYHGKIKFPPEFPFRPPSIFMITPNGRFKTNFRLCLSMSDYHPDTWNPAWTVSTILNGLLSFMLENTVTLGSLDTSEEEKMYYARKSIDFNMGDPVFRELFPEIYQECRQLIMLREESQERIQSRRHLPGGSSQLPQTRTRGFLMNTRLGRYIQFLRSKTRKE